MLTSNRMKIILYTQDTISSLKIPSIIIKYLPSLHLIIFLHPVLTVLHSKFNDFVN